MSGMWLHWYRLSRELVITASTHSGKLVVFILPLISLRKWTLHSLFVPDVFPILCWVETAVRVQGVCQLAQNRTIRPLVSCAMLRKAFKHITHFRQFADFFFELEDMFLRECLYILARAFAVLPK